MANNKHAKSELSLFSQTSLGEGRDAEIYFPERGGEIIG